ncbi:endonuclease V [Streptococcus oricebi]|uniref:Endonuclease V n=1 Tax=Streptococcus oricebi TaxID=1547447 RepID=A0ABS5B5S1_9STRE|nr:endonuclease V [Streptococcus oricebi]MBP2623831.1 endonuclease V [Streptococcus oricebi]
MTTTFKEEQERWQGQISLQNNFSVEDLHTVAGVDIAYWQRDSKEYGVACIVVFDNQTKEVLEEVSASAQIEVPYKAGYLAFRELPLVLKAVEKLQTDVDLYMFDGNGYLHPRHMGIATHASFYLGKPTIGVAKQFYKVEGVDFQLPTSEKGSFSEIKNASETYGLVVRTRSQVKPVYVSCGNWIDLETAYQITMHFVKDDSRLPVTTRYADIRIHRERQRLIKEKVDR